MDYMDPDVLCPKKKPINLVSLFLSFITLATTIVWVMWFEIQQM